MNQLARTASESGPRFGTFRLLSLLFIWIMSLAATPPAQATAIATGSISITNFTITPNSGVVAFTSPWTAQAFAQAQNSLCGCDSQFNSSLGGVAQADAMVMFAQGHALADVSSLNLSASAASNIPGGVMAANSTGQSTLFNTTFFVTGGSGPVDVTFSATVDIMQSLFTDVSGVSAASDASYTLSVDGQNVLFTDSFKQVGPSSSWSNSSSDTLTGTITLNFDKMYSLYSSDDTETPSYDLPEPPSGSLLLLGAALLTAQRVFVTFRG